MNCKYQTVFAQWKTIRSEGVKNNLFCNNSNLQSIFLSYFDSKESFEAPNIHWIAQLSVFGLTWPSMCSRRINPPVFQPHVWSRVKHPHSPSSNTMYHSLLLPQLDKTASEIFIMTPSSAGSIRTETHSGNKPHELVHELLYMNHRFNVLAPDIM